MGNHQQLATKKEEPKLAFTHPAMTREELDEFVFAPDVRMIELEVWLNKDRYFPYPDNPIRVTLSCDDRFFDKIVYPSKEQLDEIVNFFETSKRLWHKLTGSAMGWEDGVMKVNKYNTIYTNFDIELNPKPVAPLFPGHTDFVKIIRPKDIGTGSLIVSSSASFNEGYVDTYVDLRI